MKKPIIRLSILVLIPTLLACQKTTEKSSVSFVSSVENTSSSVEISSNEESISSVSSISESSSESSLSSILESSSPSNVSSSSIVPSSSSTYPSNYNKTFDYYISEHDWIDERDQEYTHLIKKPSEPVHDMLGLIAITDYYGFYKVENFKVEIAEDYKFSESNIRNFEKELVCLYDVGELLNGVMGFDATFDGKYLNFTLDIYHNAYIETKPSTILLDDILYEEKVDLRNSTYNEFATENASKPVADVYSTQQLWYAAQYGYRINCFKGSPAEKYYNLAKDVLRNICSDSMSEKEKYRSIFEYVLHNSTYDYEALEIPNASNPDKYPDEYCSRYKGYFIEGFFDDHTVVCDGYAKVITLLSNMEGLDVIRSSGMDDELFRTKNTSGHAYNYVRFGEEEYLSDCTWCYAYAPSFGSIYESASYCYYLSGYNAHEKYTARKVSKYGYDIPASLPLFVNYYKDRTIDIDGTTYSLIIKNNDDVVVEYLLNKAKNSGKGGHTFELMFDSSESYRKFVNQYSKYVATGGGISGTSNYLGIFYVEN
ncbi:MAG: hypothetical protein MJ217_00800 [Bacilli bacterium]|nr:hypothetical protein [Bacilli bacterium]